MPTTQRAQRILLASIGSLGDLHPVLGLALELKQRGHSVCIASTPFYCDKVNAFGLEFQPLRPAWDPTETSLIAQCESIRRGPEVLLRRMVLPHLRDTYTDLLEAAKDRDAMVAGELVFAAPLVAEKLGLRWASATLSPCSFLSAYDPPVLPPVQELEYLRGAGPGFHRILLRLSRAATNHWWKPIRELRRKEGLGPGGNPLFEDKFSKDLVLALFSKALAQPQPDWPANTVQTGFVYYDRMYKEDSLPSDLVNFLDSGTPPILFTQGSTAVHNPGKFYETSVEAARRLRQRALLLGAHEATYGSGPDVFAAGYAPYSQVFPCCSVIVHQGGVGTTANAMQAGRPMLIVPYGWDQPDQAARVVRMGAGLTIARTRYTPRRAAETLRRLIDEESFEMRAAKVREEMQAEDGLASACDAVEELLCR